MLTAAVIITPRACPFTLCACLLETNIPAEASLYDRLDIPARCDAASITKIPACPINPETIASVFLSQISPSQFLLKNTFEIYLLIKQAILAIVI